MAAFLANCYTLYFILWTLRYANYILQIYLHIFFNLKRTQIVYKSKKKKYLIKYIFERYLLILLFFNSEMFKILIFEVFYTYNRFSDCS